MTIEITDKTSVEKFIQNLVDYNLILDLDSSFHDYYHADSHERFFDQETADLLDEKLEQCFAYCNQNDLDIYLIALIAQTKQFEIIGLYTHEQAQEVLENSY